jgi:hypothetical protein
MGLDMTLLRKTYIKGENYNITVERKEAEGSHVNPERIFYIVEEIHYWRKANQIHNWFVNNLPEGVENCYPNHVERCNLEQLLQECKRVLENKELAPKVLPTVEGFFFGSTEYDDDYFKDLEGTVNMLENILSEGPDCVFQYLPWW